MATDLETARERLQAYYDAEKAILAAGQEGSVGTRRRREADLEQIRAAIRELKAEIAGLEGSGSRLVQVVFS